jgi:UPF0755 protein
MPAGPSPSHETESDVPEWVNGPEQVSGGEPWETAAVPGDGPVGRDRDWHRPHPWARRILVGVGVAFVVLLVAAGGLVVWVNGHLNGTGGAAVAVTLPAHAGHATIASDLTRAGAVSDAWLFRRYLDYRDYPPLQGGQYTLHRHEGYRHALQDLGDGPEIVQSRLTIPEGYDLQQIAALVGRMPGLSAQRFLQLARSGAVRSAFEPPGSNDLEGLLFPDTYFIDPGETEQDVLQTLVSRFDQVATDANLANSAATNGLTPYQTVVVASIVEREAKVEPDRGKIARVILNRLAANMKLQIDATVEYALGVHKDRLSDADTHVSSPYNTYVVAGLPPGPIASPGVASLQAAINPTPGSWLYYVLVDPDGHHGFATTRAQFDKLLAEAHAKGLA